MSTEAFEELTSRITELNTKRSYIQRLLQGHIDILDSDIEALWQEVYCLHNLETEAKENTP